VARIKPILTNNELRTTTTAKEHRESVLKLKSFPPRMAWTMTENAIASMIKAATTNVFQRSRKGRVAVDPPDENVLDGFFLYYLHHEMKAHQTWGKTLFSGRCVLRRETSRSLEQNSPKSVFVSFNITEMTNRRPMETRAKRLIYPLSTTNVTKEGPFR
jgi:hypothetical protein